MRYLIIYDADGNILHKEKNEGIVNGMEQYIFDIPDGAEIIGMNMDSDPYPVYIVPEERKQTDDIKDMISELDESNSLALVDMYENIISMEEKINLICEKLGIEV